MKELIYLSMAPAIENKDIEINIENEKILVKQIGIDFNLPLLKDLVDHYSGKVDAIAVSGLPGPIKVGQYTITHPIQHELKKLAGPTPLVDGSTLRHILIPWALNHFLKNNPLMFKNKKVGFFTGLVHKNYFDEILSTDCEILMADFYFLAGVPLLLKSSKNLDQLINIIKSQLTKKQIDAYSHCDFSLPYLKLIPGFKEFFDCDIYFINSSQLDFITLPDLTGKTIIVDTLSERNLSLLKSKNVSNIFQCQTNKAIPELNKITLLEGVLQILNGTNNSLGEKKIIEYIEKLNLKPEIINFNAHNSQKTITQFGFVIHPLSKSDLLKLPLIKKINRNKLLQNITEKACSYLPSFQYGEITGIKSEFNGKEVHGNIFAITETPKMIMQKNKNAMYDKLIGVTHKAQQLGCKIFGLGAYTKIFGDAGVTIHKNSPIPVTTGNSLSAASTLWAANYALERLGFIQKINHKYPGTVMIVGATGSIGKVNAKILCQYWDHVVIVAPKLFKLIELKQELEQINPLCKISISQSADDYSSICDLIITSTSAKGEKILDITLIKPGCVICDVSRPFDIPMEDAMTRPDVLVIASGEVELPGEVQINFDMGLQGKTVYACLAETALLAMEERFEPFSMSRDISFEKVFEIDLLARKHGIKLSNIMGHLTEITDEEIDLCRTHALKKLINNDFHVSGQ
jgi:predicted amino acid dehydrogenase